MSKIGSKPIVVPAGVTVESKDGWFIVKGKLATLSVLHIPFVKAEIKDGVIQLTINSSKKQARANWGTLGANLKNALTGVTEGFTKSLEIQGIGFKAAMEGNNLSLNVGYSHPVKYVTPEGIKIVIEKSFIRISGSDKYLVGQTAAEIRKIKKPEPYQGKGIRYVGEQVRRKAGKKVAGATGAAA
ncbi:MAG: 50S ribosomal protein L6 [bacterium]|nr:50S ribosomal protein L6 [bacterium]